MSQTARFKLRFPIPTATSGGPGVVARHLRVVADCLVRERECTLALPADVLARPRTILAGLETLSWGRRIGLRVSSELGPLIDPLLTIDKATLLSDARLVRLCALALSIAGETGHAPEKEEALAVAADLEPTGGSDVTRQDGLDLALAALMLHSQIGSPRWAVARLPQLIDSAVTACDALSCAYLLGYGATSIAAQPPARIAGWLDFFDSMTPHSRPFGWLDDVTHEPAEAADFEIASLVALIGLHHAGVASAIID